MTMTEQRIEITPDLVKSVAFGDIDPETEKVLLSDEFVVELYSAARALATDLNVRIGEYTQEHALGRPVNTDWRRRAGAVYGRVAALCSRLRPLAADAQRRRNNASLLDAIRLHRETTLAEFEPTAADHELWAVLEGGTR